MEFRIKVSLMEVAKQGVLMFDIGEDYTLMLIHEEDEHITALVCTDERLKDVMRGIINENTEP